MASGIAGLDAVKGRLASYEAALRARMDEAIERAAKEFQADLVALAPAKSGDLRAALSSTDAVQIERTDAGLKVTVGFLSTAQKKKAFHGFFVEFGTKGYKAGQKRFAGKTKRGDRRMVKVKRDIPARPAHPFFRPAVINLLRNLERLRREAHALALLDMVRG